MRWLHKIGSSQPAGRSSQLAGRSSQRATCRSHWRATCPLTQNTVLRILG